MKNKITNLLKTTAAVATLMAGSQTWGATAYDPGAAITGERYDTVTLGTVGSYTAFTAPGPTIKKLFVNISTSLAVGDIIANNLPAATVIPATVQEIWYLGDALGLSTANGVAANALPTPPANSIIHFNLSVAPAAACTWFIDNLPVTCSIIIEKGSADPKLADAQYARVKSLSIGRNITLSGGLTFSGKVSRHTKVVEADMTNLGQLTLGGDTIFSKGIQGLKLVAGAHAVTFNDTADLPDPTGTGTWTIAASKKLTIRDVAATFNLSAPSAYILGTKSEVSLKK